jgi:hypothetical protein
MGNINKTPEQSALRKDLFRIGIEVTEQQLGKTERIPRIGKPSVRLVRNGNKHYKVAIRTTQDGWIGFQRNGKEWNTLTGMDWVVIVAVDDRHNPKLARVHLIPGDEMRDRFDRAYSARTAAGHRIPNGQPMWISVYGEDKSEPVSLVAAGVGLIHPAIAEVPLQRGSSQELVRKEPEQTALDTARSFEKIIADAKRGLSLSLGVDISRIKIVVEL